MRRKLPPKDPDRRHSARIADFINAIGQTRSSAAIRDISAWPSKAEFEGASHEVSVVPLAAVSGR
jgi:hypothetical protein